ncbi:hypothetical protein SB717_38860, partial [Priestia sp. SIMBA_032]|uniref:hypothetical protein n=1 Tax=Priestia sp. SIMBA_032 TaxID=3085775 RepID=UPI00397A4C07
MEELSASLASRPDWEPMVILVRLRDLEQLVTRFSYRVGQDLVKAFARRLEGQDFALCGYFGPALFVVVPRH